MRILITGGSGRLGSQLIQDLKDQHQVFAPSSVDMNIVSTRDVRDFFDHCKPDLVIHSAALTDVDYCDKDPVMANMVNVEGTRNMVHSSVYHKSLMVFVSTDFVFDGRESFGYFENHWRNPINIYGRTKQLAEDIVLKDGFAVVRTSWLFDDHNPSLVTKILDRIDSGLDLKYQTKRRGRMTYVPDLSHFIADLGTSSKANGIYHFATCPSMSAYAIAQMVARSYMGENCPEIEPDIRHPETAGGAPRPANSSIYDSKRINDSKDSFALSRVHKIVKDRLDKTTI